MSSRNTKIINGAEVKGMLLTLCWCERWYIYVLPEVVQALMTESCDDPNCKPTFKGV